MRTQIIIVLAAVAWAAPARADESEGARLFREGRAQMLEGHFEVACPKIAESQRLEPHVGTLLNLAACHERQGKVASAWVEYQKALTAARADGQPERAKLAQQRIDVLEPRVPWLGLAPPLGTSSSDLVITLDGAIVQPVAWGKEMPVDPGPHVVGARAPGHPSFEEAIELREGEHRTSTITFGDAASAPAVDGAEKVPPLVVDPAAGAAPPSPEPRSRWVLEPGVFIGYLSVSTERARPTGSEGAIAVSDNSSTSSGPSLSCASVGCTYALSTQTGAVIGPNLFAGYALSEDFTAGLRLIAAPRLDRGGGSIVAIGPSASLRASPSWSFGAWALLGSATVGALGGAEIEATAPYRVQQNGGFIALSASTQLGFGLGFEASFRIVTLSRGALLATATPFFLVGANGSAFTAPLGIAYRFQ